MSRVASRRCLLCQVAVKRDIAASCRPSVRPAAILSVLYNALPPSVPPPRLSAVPSTFLCQRYLQQHYHYYSIRGSKCIRHCGQSRGWPLGNSQQDRETERRFMLYNAEIDRIGS